MVCESSVLRGPIVREVLVKSVFAARYVSIVAVVFAAVGAVFMFVVRGHRLVLFG